MGSGASNVAVPSTDRGEPSARNTGSASAEYGLASDLSDLARELQREEDPEAILVDVVQAAVRLIPGVQEGSISVVTARRRVASRAPSGELPRRVDKLQAETGEGPCMDAAYEQQTVRVPDMAHERRWPRFAPAALAAGAASMLSFQLYVERDDLGALNLYSRQPNAFDDESEQVGLMFAAHAAIAYAHAAKASHLGQAVASRDLIGQAKGILMERYKINGDQAFRLLTRLSQDANRKLRDVAEELVHSGELPGQRN